MYSPEINKTSASCETWWSKGPVIPEAVHYKSPLAYDEMFKTILMKNQLCVIGPEATKNWRSRQLWVKPDGTPNFEYIKENFGDVTAPVADCSRVEYNAHSKLEMTVKDFVDYWEDYGAKSYDKNERCLYLKDWHFTRDFPKYKAYTPPDFLCSDWLNEFWGSLQSPSGDDYKFVYMGPRGSWTPFHADVLHSYSWSANICGRKKWIIYPPGCEDYLRDKNGHLIFDLSSLELCDSSQFPESSKAQPITVIQEQGEIIFVPSGWHHQVFNLEDTISINHNWTNGCGAHLCWEFLKSRLSAVQREISDCRDMDGWHEHCQLILKSDSGIDYAGFLTFMAAIAEHRMEALRDDHTTYSSLGTQDLTVQENRTCLCLYKTNKEFNCELEPVSKDNNLYLDCDKDSNRNKLSEISESKSINSSNDLHSEAHEDIQCQANIKEVRVEGHLSCPHWSHCGRNLALFDLSRVKDIVQNILKQPEITAVLSQLNFNPKLLILQIEKIEKQLC